MSLTATNMTRDSQTTLNSFWPEPASHATSVWENSYTSIRSDFAGSIRDEKGNYREVSDIDIDNYAQRVLVEYAAFSSTSKNDEITEVDNSLGPYITNSLRTWKNESASKSVTIHDIPKMPLYQPLCELLQEHCSISTASLARQAMETIAQAVLERKVLSSIIITPTTTRNAMQSLAESLHSQYSLLSIETGDTTNEKASHNINSDENREINIEASNIVSPLAVGNLIPLDLLDEVDPLEALYKEKKIATPLASNRQPSPYRDTIRSQNNDDEAFPPLSALMEKSTKFSRSTSKSKPPTSKTGGAKSKGYKADDLAASLFRHPRSRQSSIDETSIATNSTNSISPSLQAIHQSNISTSPLMNNMLLPSCDDAQDTQRRNDTGAKSNFNEYQAIDQLTLSSSQTDESRDNLMMMMHHCSEYLISMSPDLSTSAAFAASDLCQGNIVASQYLINAAASAPPICRHLLNAGCYRADCQFSHALDSHTCIFWLKGRCSRQFDNTSSQANACRFLHGFHPKLLQEIPQECFVAQPAFDEQNDYYEQQYIDDQHHSNVYNVDEYDYQYAGNANQNTDSNLYEDYKTIRSDGLPIEDNTYSYQNSFAQIASQGYNKNLSFTKGPIKQLSGTEIVDVRTLPTAKIPQDLWNPYENRDSTAFYIPDPMERYYYVKSTIRTQMYDVIDLHFQSIKTFAVVLDTLFEDYDTIKGGGGTWIITGTGHHVGTQTHQKGGGALETAVLQYLMEHYSDRFSIYRGLDRNGISGAILIKRIVR